MRLQYGLGTVDGAHRGPLLARARRGALPRARGPARALRRDAQRPERRARRRVSVRSLRLPRRRGSRSTRTTRRSARRSTGGCGTSAGERGRAGPAPRGARRAHEHAVRRPDGDGPAGLRPAERRGPLLRRRATRSGSTSTSRVQVLADAGADAGLGRRRAAAAELWLLSRPMLTIPLVEQLKRRGLFSLHAGAAARDGRALAAPRAERLRQVDARARARRRRLGLHGRRHGLPRTARPAGARRSPTRSTCRRESRSWFPALGTRRRAAATAGRSTGCGSRTCSAADVADGGHAGGARVPRRRAPSDRARSAADPRPRRCSSSLRTSCSPSRESSQAHLDALGELVRLGARAPADHRPRLRRARPRARRTAGAETQKGRPPRCSAETAPLRVLVG